MNLAGYVSKQLKHKIKGNKHTHFTILIFRPLQSCRLENQTMCKWLQWQTKNSACCNFKTSETRYKCTLWWWIKTEKTILSAEKCVFSFALDALTYMKTFSCDAVIRLYDTAQILLQEFIISIKYLPAFFRVSEFFKYTSMIICTAKTAHTKNTNLSMVRCNTAIETKN